MASSLLSLDIAACELSNSRLAQQATGFAYSASWNIYTPQSTGRGNYFGV